MKSIIQILIGALLIFTISPALLWSQESNPDADREIIVMFQPDIVQLPADSLSAELDKISISSTELRSVLDTNRVDYVQKAFPNFDPSDTLKITEEGLVIKSPDLTQVFKLRLPIDQDRLRAIDDLKRLPEVIYAEPNANTQLRLIPNDQYFDLQWNMFNTGQYGGTPGADIHATEAWDIWQGTSSVMIAVVDGGVYPHYSDLSGRVSGNTGSSSHATHVAGIAAANGNNSFGVAGVDWNCSINSQIRGDIPQTAAAVRAAVDAGARIVNDSWGQGNNFFLVTLASAFAYAYKSNAVSCAAMPEDGSPEDYPNAYGQGILNVGASTNGDKRSWYSFARPYIDVAAPGGNFDGVNGRNILSTVPTDGYAYNAGTSMAAPHATGTASLLKGYASSARGLTLYNDDLEQILRISADDINDPNDPTTGPGWDQGTGTGRINARKALEFLQFPYSLVHLNKPVGYDYASDLDYICFYDTPGIGQGDCFFARKHEVRRFVDFPHAFVDTPYVWGRGVPTIGYSPENPNFGMGFCDVVPGSVTPTECNVYTYCYYDIFGEEWYPTYYTGTSFFLTILGEYKLDLGAIPTSRDVTPAIVVSWNNAYSNEEGYELERKDATNNQWEVIETFDPDVTVIWDYVPVGSETYTYKVRGFGDGKYGTYSNEKEIKSRPNPPTDFEALVECIGGTAKAVPSSSDPQTPPPTLYSGGPPGGCQKTNQVFLYWSPPDNQKLDIDYYMVKIVEWGGPTTYEGPIYGLCDTLCLETLTSYNLYVYAVDTEGDEGYYSSVQTITTGHKDMCPDYPNKLTANTNLPEDFFLGQNYPNPFNAQTQIEYDLPEDCNVKLVIYNILGEKVRVLIDEFQSAGIRNIFWDGKNDRGEKVASGIYLYQIQAGSFTKTAKMSLLK